MAADGVALAEAPCVVGAGHVAFPAGQGEDDGQAIQLHDGGEREHGHEGNAGVAAGEEHGEGEKHGEAKGLGGVGVRARLAAEACETDGVDEAFECEEREDGGQPRREGGGGTHEARRDDAEKEDEVGLRVAAAQEARGNAQAAGDDAVEDVADDAEPEQEDEQPARRAGEGERDDRGAEEETQGDEEPGGEGHAGC